MAESTNIEWTDHTFNPWIGCAKVSPGCKNCYTATQDKFRHWTPEGWGGPRKRTSVANWNGPVKWNSSPDVWEHPLTFCASLADWLDDQVPIKWLSDLLHLIYQTPNLRWQVLTKRPGNWADRLESVYFGRPVPAVLKDWCIAWLNGTPPSNVWIGTTVEDQARADERIPILLSIPARVRFLSCEPLLESVDITPFMQAGGTPALPWVICGGESGPGARPMHPDWARGLRDQCASNGVPFFFKQWGEWAPAQNGGLTAFAKVGKKRAGCLLDGVEHKAFPRRGEVIGNQTGESNQSPEATREALQSLITSAPLITDHFPPP